MKFNIPQKYQRLKRILIWSLAFIVLLQVAYFVFDQYETKRIMKELSKEKEKIKPEPVMLFNIPIDSFTVVPGKIRSGQNLSDILVKENVSMTKVDEISKKSILTFDVRKMKVNNPYYFFMNKKQPSKVEYFIYEINPVDYVVYDLSDSLRIYKEKKPIVTQIKTASGVITSSLWNAMQAQALDTDLAMNLSDIYAWSIDFFGLQKGDKFRVVYEESFVSGKSIGIGTIFAAQFVHAKEDFYAFRFTQNNEDLENAAKYTPTGSRIVIKGVLQGSELRLSVIDNGPGLPPGREEALFEKFARAKSETSTPGVGLGLAICRAIMQAHQGRIWAEATPGGGATFVLALPLGTPPALPEFDDHF